MSPLLTTEVKSEDNTEEIIAKARARMEQKDYEGTIKVLTDIADKDRRALLGIAYSHYNLKNYDKTVEFTEKALEKYPDDFVARKFLVFAYFKKDDLAKSLKNAEAALAIKKDEDVQALHDRIKRERSTKQTYTHESTNHFKVTFDGYEQGRISRTVIDILEDAYKYVGNELNYFPNEPITVILYTNRDFMDTTRAPGWAAGVFDRYDGKIRVPVKGVEGKESDLKRILYHEYTHAVVHSLTLTCPLWINEGLAEYFSRTYEKKLWQVIPLNYLEHTFAGVRGDKIWVAYWESHSAVSYLIEKYSLYRMKDLLVSFSKDPDTNKAFRETFGITYNDFLASWGKKE